MKTVQGIDPNGVYAELHLVLQGPQVAYSVNVHGRYFCAIHGWPEISNPTPDCPTCYHLGTSLDYGDQGGSVYCTWGQS